jgi:hypothetical protein
VYQLDATLAHQITIAQFAAQIQRTRKNHDLLLKMPPFDQLLYRYKF